MYNAEIKERFINERYIGYTRNNVRFILNKSEETELVLNKDIYSFNRFECDKLLKNFSNRSVFVVASTVSILKQYVTWCIEQGFLQDRINYFNAINPGELKDYVDKDVAANKYITYEQLKEMQGMCVNAQDAICPTLPFWGIKGEEASEILNLKITDIQPNKIILPDREIEIDDHTYTLIQDAINQTEYSKGNGEVSVRSRSTDLKIMPTEFILRAAGAKKKGRMNYYSFIVRLNRIKTYFDNPYITINNLWVSGMIHLAKQIKAEKGELTKEDYQMINKKFGYNPNNWFPTKTRIQDYI